jgi:hypothetical protein
MQALLIQRGDTTAAVPLANARLSTTAGYDESWLQSLLFDHPQLLPLDVIDPGARSMIPICRELPMPGGGGTVFLDILGITTAGRPRGRGPTS